MNILFISAILPYPLYSGGQVRIYNLLKRLSRTHAIHLFSFIRDEDENKWKKELDFCKSVTTVYRGRARQAKYLIKAVCGRYPWLLATYDNTQMRKAVELKLSQQPFGLIHIEPGYVWPSVPNTKIPLVVSEHNIEYEVYDSYVNHFSIPFLRPALRGDVRKIQLWEKRIWQKAASVIAVSESDKKYISSEVASDKVFVVPNGVDLVRFPFSPKKSVNEKSLTFFFVGNFAWIQNRDSIEYLLTTLWPSISKKYPGAHVKIVGKNFPDSLRHMMNDHIALLDHVDDIAVELRRADIMLAPIRVGGGTKYKILEAMGSGLPVITTTKGIEGLALANGKNIIVADTINETISAIDILMDSRHRMSIVSSARELIEKSYSWDIIAKSLENVWETTCERAN